MRQWWLSLLSFLCWSLFLVSPSAVAAQVPPTSCQGGSGSLADYVAPRCPGGACEHIFATSVDSTARHITSVENFVDWADSTTFKQHSNQYHFLYRKEGGYIKFMQDSVWGGFNCTNGKKAMYRVFDAGSNNWGANSFPEDMACGSSSSSSQYIKTFEYSEAIEEKYDANLSSCTVDGQSDGNGVGATITVSTLYFYQGKAKCGSRDVEVAGLTNSGGAGFGEVYFYCKDIGLCAWYEKLDFSKTGNNPTTWGPDTDICDLETDLLVPEISGPDYYTYPIRTLLNNNASKNKNFPEKIADELIEQGYEVACTSPKLLFASDLVGVREMAQAYGTTTTDIKQNYLPSKSWSSTQYLDYTQGKVPIFRADPEGGHEESLETFWGQDAGDKTDADIDKEIAAAPLYRLLSDIDQCRVKKDLLKTIVERCNELQASIGDCPLNQEIVKKDTKTKKTIRKNPSKLYEAIKDTSCEILTGPTEDEELKTNKELLRALPFYLNKSYRLGFVVMTARVFSKPDVWPWQFMTPDDEDPENNMTPKHETRVIAFRLPEVAANTIPLSKDNKTTPYIDPLWLTRNSLTNLESIQKHQEDYQTLRELLREETAKAISDREKDPQAGMIINCRGPYCEDPLSKALIGMVNASLSKTYMDKLNKLAPPLSSNDQALISNFQLVNEAWQRHYGSDEKIAEDLEAQHPEGENSVEKDDTQPAKDDAEEVTDAIYNSTFTCAEQSAALKRFESPKELTDNLAFKPPEVSQNKGVIFEGPINLIQKLFKSEEVETSEDENQQSLNEEERENYGTVTPAQAQRVSINFRNVFDPPKLPRNPLVNLYSAYLVYPVGYDLRMAEDALAGAFKTQEERVKFATDPKVKPYFLLSGISQDYQSEDETFPYEVGVGVLNCTETEALEPEPADTCTRYVWYKAIDLGLQEAAQFDNSYNQQRDVTMRPRVQGGILGQLMRDTQLTLRALGTREYEYIDSCKTTEDFLLGRCGDTDISAALKCAQDNPNDPKKLQECLKKEGEKELTLDSNPGTTPSTCVDVWMSDPADQNAASDYLRANLASQQKSTPTFAGWARYFVGRNESLYKNQHLFQTSCGGQLCYEYILDKIAGTSINPYLAIAISLNETGGLYSDDPGHIGPHFGCAPKEHGSIEEKLTCMISTLNSYQRAGLDNDAALRKYGYANGTTNYNLNKIIGILSGGNYNGSCKAATPDTEK